MLMPFHTFLATKNQPLQMQKLVIFFPADIVRRSQPKIDTGFYLEETSLR
jgi:hypothetical protein